LINVLGGADFSEARLEIGGLAPGFEYTDVFEDGAFTLTAQNDGVSTTTPEPGSAWLLGALLVFFTGAFRNRLKNRI
jgi:hypothetical protein